MTNKKLIDRSVKVSISLERYNELLDLEKNPDRTPQQVADDYNHGFDACLRVIMDMKSPTRLGNGGVQLPAWLDTNHRQVIDHMRMGRL